MSDKKPRKLLLTTYLSPGDTVMFTAAVRDLHLAYPFQFLTDIDTTGPAIWHHNPYITKLNWHVEYYKQENGTHKRVAVPDDHEVEVFPCHYPLVNSCNDKPYHFIHGYTKYLEEKLGIRIPITTFRGDIHICDLEKRWMSQVEEEPIGLKRGFWIIVAGGKHDFTCVKEGSRVQTNNGYKRIEDVNPDDMIFTEYGYKKSGGSICRGFKSCLTIKTHTSEITVSDNHKFKIFNGNEIIWKEAKNLKCGDNILCKYHSNINANQDDTDKWFATGFLWGDGCLNKRKNRLESIWIFSEEDIKARKRISAWLDENNINYFTTTRSPKNNQTQRSFRITTNAKILDLPSFVSKGQWRNNGFPESYFNLDLDSQKALLQGLFSSDGTIDKIGNISYTSISKQLVEDIRRLLWQCGILSSISEHEFKSIFGRTCVHFRIHILGKSSNNKFKSIGFYNPKKDARLQSHEYKWDKLIGIKNAREIIESLQTKKNATKEARLTNDRKPANIRRDLLKHQFIPESLMSKINKYFNYPTSLNELLENNWYCSEVTDIKDAGDQKVYDIINSETESYIVEGTIAHNCKWWSPDKYQAVVDYFRGKIKFVQVGEKNHFHPPLKNVINLIGKTDLRQLIRLVYHADGVLCPVTLTMHLAAAIETKRGKHPDRPCVVVAGGREGPQWEAYPNHQYIHTCGALPCCQKGGCWKSRCQKVGDGDKKDEKNLCKNPIQISPELRIPQCMHMINEYDVIRRIEHYYDGGVLEYYK